MKRLYLLCSFLFVTSLWADELESILSENKSLLFDYQFQSNELQSDILSKSWINPVTVRYGKDYTTRFKTGTIDTGNFSVYIDQPIFRSGGIYYAIKYSGALRNANRADITLQRRQMIGDAVSILFQLKKIRLEQQKMRYQVKNDLIDIQQKRDSYEAGLLDSSFLDQAILKKSQDETALLEMKLNEMELKQRFSLLSDKAPEKLRLPKLKLIDKQSYTRENLELKRDSMRALEMDYKEKVTWAKYLPTVSLNAQYNNGDLNPLFPSPNLNEAYYNYGFSVSMPLDVNAFSDIELSKVEKLRAATEVLDRKDTISEEYDWIRNSLGILDRKIALARKDEKIYGNLYKVTKNLVQAGEKTSLDADVMKNSLQIRKIDQRIYSIDKQIQLLKLYIRVENVL
ncbi:TolC family protein [Sulfurovum riftiae]|uniref:TolC family protein n=1 Tax=Sulfurovum riftiae TaxID=1630136 RepID=UPI000A611904|nr:TolC family protein [Sulfurovum riftiae]